MGPDQSVGGVHTEAEFRGIVWVEGRCDASDAQACTGVRGVAWVLAVTSIGSCADLWPCHCYRTDAPLHLDGILVSVSPRLCASIVSSVSPRLPPKPPVGGNIRPPRNQSHPSRPSHHLANLPLVLPRQPGLCPGSDTAHLVDKREGEVRVECEVERVGGRGVEGVDLLRDAFGGAEEWWAGCGAGGGVQGRTGELVRRDGLGVSAWEWSGREAAHEPTHLVGVERAATDILLGRPRCRRSDHRAALLSDGRGRRGRSRRRRGPQVLREDVRYGRGVGEGSRGVEESAEDRHGGGAEASSSGEVSEGCSGGKISRCEQSAMLQRTVETLERDQTTVGWSQRSGLAPFCFRPFRALLKKICRAEARPLSLAAQISVFAMILK